MVNFETITKLLTKEKNNLAKMKYQAVNEAAVSLKSQYEKETENFKAFNQKIRTDLE